MCETCCEVHRLMAETKRDTKSSCKQCEKLETEYHKMVGKYQELLFKECKNCGKLKEENAGLKTVQQTADELKEHWDNMLKISDSHRQELTTLNEENEKLVKDYDTACDDAMAEAREKNKLKKQLADVVEWCEGRQEEEMGCKNTFLTFNEVISNLKNIMEGK